jgi:hypothetical protein
LTSTILEGVLVPPESLKYRWRLSGKTRGLVEILCRLQKIYRGSGNFSAAVTFPEPSIFFQRVFGTVLGVLK